MKYYEIKTNFGEMEMMELPLLDYIKRWLNAKL